jgi:hypothetical protein
MRMDAIAGAVILAERFSAMRRPSRPAPIRTASALPLFHWVGVEPPGADSEPPAGVGARTTILQLRLRGLAEGGSGES